MSDKNENRNWLVSPTRDIDEAWIKVQIQERISRINRHLQDIDDLKKAKIVGLEATVKLLRLEQAKLERDLMKSQSISVEPGVAKKEK